MDGIERFFQLPVPGQIDTFQVFFQLGQAGGTNNIAGDKGAGGDELQGQLGRAQAALLCQLAVGLGGGAGLIVGIAAELFDLGEPGPLRPLVVAVFPGQHAKSQGRVGQ